MIELLPKTAAELASKVYDVQDELTVISFLARKEFSNNSGQKHQLKAQVGGRIFRNATDGFGVCALGGEMYPRQLFIVFRGSTNANNNADWVSNGRIGITPSKTGFPVHIGFNHIFSSMLPEIRKFIDEHEKSFDIIHCIGHSLGGAIATLTADWLKSNKGKTIKLYTFGAPKPGLMLFSANLTRKLGKENIFRAYHPTDPVPMIPLFPYVHAPLPGYGHYINTYENTISVAAHDMETYIKSVSTFTWGDFERKSPPYTIETAVEQWLRSKAPVSASSPKIWEWINAGLIYVLKKILGSVAHLLQASFMGVFTVADTIAYILHKGINLKSTINQWVLRLMRKIMQALGMKVKEKKEELTQAIMREALIRVMNKTTNEAKKAVMKI